jgi:oligopeptide transport system permease protein
MSRKETLSIHEDMLKLLDDSEKNKEFIAIESRTYFQDVWLRFKRNKIAVAGLIFIFIITAFAIFGPIFSEFSYDGVDLSYINQEPDSLHWFGTDFLGRDIYVRILYGARISLSVGFLVAIFNLCIGTIYGGIAGYFGGLADLIMMRIVEMVYAMPTLLYVILIMMFFGGSVFTVVFAIVISSWVRMARIVRAQVLSLKEQEFILAARVIGADKKRILFRHLLLNCMGPILVTVTLNVPAAIFTEAFLSFVGVGISIPMASWGTLANEALPAIFTRPYQLFFPLAAISSTMFSLNFIGDGLSDAIDPKRK